MGSDCRRGLGIVAGCRLVVRIGWRIRGLISRSLLMVMVFVLILSVIFLVVRSLCYLMRLLNVCVLSPVV